MVAVFRHNCVHMSSYVSRLLRTSEFMFLYKNRLDSIKFVYFVAQKKNCEINIMRRLPVRAAVIGHFCLSAKTIPIRSFRNDLFRKRSFNYLHISNFIERIFILFLLILHIFFIYLIASTCQHALKMVCLSFVHQFSS